MEIEHAVQCENHRPEASRPTRWWMPLGAMALLWLAGCAGPGLTPLSTGLTEAEVVQRWGTPTGRHALPDGARLEYATGPMGVETWMVDLDDQGRTRTWRQVLDWRYLQQVQADLPGMSREQVLTLLGRPSEVRGGGFQGGEVWSWRHQSPFCLWLQASVGEDGRLRDGGFYPDPACDAKDDNDR
jgi:hypothetical protein